MTGLIAIHQPNFFPWLGYFDKIRRADRFVFLDAVDYPRAGSGSMGSWVNRVRILINGEARWVTCPVRRMPLGYPVFVAEIDDSRPWRAKLLKTLEANYRRAPRYTDAMALLEPLIRLNERHLADFNMAAITAISTRLGVATQFLRQSELAQDGTSTERLIALVKAAKGDTYLAGGGAGGYQDEELFATRGVRLLPQQFVPRPYGDPTRFVAGLSVIDYLMHDGRMLAEAFPE